MKRTPVESSNIVSIGHEIEEKNGMGTLEVEFYNKDKSTSIYQYTPVSENAHLLLMAAESKGKFMHRFIKLNPHITTIKVS